MINWPLTAYDTISVIDTVTHGLLAAIPAGIGPFGVAVGPGADPIYVTNGSRDEIRAALAERGIETGIHYKPNHLLTMYGNATEHFPVAERLFDEMLTLPLHPGLTEEQQDEIVGVVGQFATAGSELLLAGRTS